MIGLLGLPTRIEEKIIPEPNSGCWLWLGAIMKPDSYGVAAVTEKGKSRLAHRIVYEGIVGLVPKGLQLDHLCRMRCCVNPDYMEVVTHRVNTLRGNSVSAICARRNHCKHGHEYTVENTIVRRGGSRRCRTCRDYENANRFNKETK
jgi:hypothetical protein